jgi:hypothetical protein
VARFFQFSTGRSLTAVALTACAALFGCASSGSGSNVRSEGIAGALSGGALPAATTAIMTPAGDSIDRLIDAVAAVLPLEDDASPVAQRERMRERAGTAHFAHEELAAGKREMARHRAGFAEQREGFASPAFVGSRNRFATGRTRPVGGPVLGGAISATLGNPDLARSLLTGAAVTQGVPVVPINPILAELLPAFGN